MPAMNKARNAYEIWKLADSEARAVEANLAEVWQNFYDKNGGPPTADLMKEVSRLRAVANDKLTEALRIMGAHQP